ncbi:MULTISPECIES: RsmD family RNA methyltransferase [Subtercola]|uniref:16S rRNA (Guanine(966)-N(2))-methyltransferase RsmD n=1 Tax=Subtercola vilae TaxID=2056433 RepID=A0A4T2BZ49_9MICO|nr:MULTISPECIES: RsmD family RNA methyltransferase [Subtercola]MEA9985530.1 RsmD family RNA methyltransferase [Subtercola sp. RTI3]TIH35146.1 16S rRNA (guanine(966)-N(2))-methyltransferase RsmD [Subtercola vilae]
MTRIIAGFAGSQRLAVPPAGTRPTSDRVREAVFSALDSRGILGGSSVLDLYAGSGALALEAVSRGAAEASIVERAPAAVRVIKANVALVQKAAMATRPTPRGGPNAPAKRGVGRPPSASPRIHVATQSVVAFLGQTVSTFDVVFIDPPYDLSEAEITEALTLLAPHLTPGADVVLERSSRSPEPALPASLILDRRKDYGETVLYWITPS